jgi:ubiquinone/menaquinone biosynthesis C-methylase UbiE
MSLNKNYTDVTEQPGQKATQEQLSMMITRYDLAAKNSGKKNVLEIACGSGTGIDYIAKKANKVVGGDIDSKLVEIAKKNYAGNSNVEVIELDALNLPFEDNTFDIVLLFEAIYYLPDVEQFLEETKRVLDKNGKIIIATVNCEWHGFNPSPFSTKYWSVKELSLLMTTHNLTPSVSVGFLDKPSGSNSLTSMIRKVAVKLRLIPTTMEGKERLKRIFYGSLKPIPAKIYENMAPLEPLIPYDETIDINNYKQLYIIGQLT